MKKVLIVCLLSAFGLGNAQEKKWSLQECVDYAVKNNLQVIQNVYNKQIQEKNLEIAKKDKLPSVSGNISNSASFGRTQFINSSVRNDNFSNNANVSGDILLFNNSRLNKVIRKTGFDVEAATYDVKTIQNNISLQIAQEYLSALLNKEIVKINQSALENAQKLYDRAKLTTEAGTTPQTTLAEATAAMAREKQNVKAAEVNVQRNLFNLVQLLQLSEYKNFDIADVNISNQIMQPDTKADQVLETAYELQPQIKAAESRIQAATAQIEVTKTAFWPVISASAGLGSFYNNLLNTNTTGVDLFGNAVYERNFFTQYSDNFGQQVALNASIPIFNKGITKVQVEQAKINEDIAKNNLEQQKLEIRRSVQQAEFDSESNYEIFLAAQEAESSSKLALDFAEKSFAAGRSTIYDLNIARNNLANAQGSTAQAKYNYLFSLKLLDFYAGIPLSL